MARRSLLPFHHHHGLLQRVMSLPQSSLHVFQLAQIHSIPVKFLILSTSNQHSNSGSTAQGRFDHIGQWGAVGASLSGMHASLIIPDTLLCTNNYELRSEVFLPRRAFASLASDATRRLPCALTLNDERHVTPYMQYVLGAFVIADYEQSHLIFAYL